ncbi:MAG: ABC transporter permease [Prochlorotrichaceae cyanobacterium]
MSTFLAAYRYALEHQDQVLQALGEHSVLVAIPLALGLLLGLPLGFWSAQSRQVSRVVINSFNGLRVIPSLAILFLAIPVLGLGWKSAILALTLLVLPPILIATEVGFRSLNPAVQEAAVGMGMSRFTRLWSVEIPLALPWIVSGIKTALVEAISSATLAAFVGAGGFGSFIVLGFALYDPSLLLVGAIPVATLALGAEVGLSSLQHYLQPGSSSGNKT